MENPVFTFCIELFRDIFYQLFIWFEDIYEATGMTSLWIGAVVLAIVFSVILIPLRGGSGIYGGVVNDFTKSAVNKHKAADFDE